MTCFGAFTGIPAIIVGMNARREIKQSGGAIGGDGLALGGIVTGAMAVFSTALSVVVFVGMMVLGSVDAFQHHPRYTPAPTPAVRQVAKSGVDPQDAEMAEAEPTAAVRATEVHEFGSLRVVELHGVRGTLGTQLGEEVARARGASKRVLAMTSAEECEACDEIFATFKESAVQRALAGVTVVVIDDDEWGSELEGLRMSEPYGPWFYLFEGGTTPVDAISADEWDANLPGNVAPVLEKFVKKNLKTRRTKRASGEAI